MSSSVYFHPFWIFHPETTALLTQMHKGRLDHVRARFCFCFLSKSTSEKKEKNAPPLFLIDRRENIQGQSLMNNTSISRWSLPRFHLWISFVWGICCLLTGSSPRTGLSVITAKSQHLLKFGGSPHDYLLIVFLLLKSISDQSIRTNIHWTVCPTNLYVDIRTLRTSKCDGIWRRDM